MSGGFIPWNFPELFSEFIYIAIFKVVAMRHSKLVINLLLEDFRPFLRLENINNSMAHNTFIVLICARRFHNQLFQLRFCERKYKMDHLASFFFCRLCRIRWNPPKTLVRLSVAFSELELFLLIEFSTRIYILFTTYE